MPKYDITPDDLWPENWCPVCGCDIGNDTDETCSYMCQQQYEGWIRDMEEDIKTNAMGLVERLTDFFVKDPHGRI